jgi:ATP-binding cassette subfamily B (MDR/TAP) protein 9
VKEIIMIPSFDRYQKKAAKFAQEFTASANNVSLWPLVGSYLTRQIHISVISLILYYINLNQVAQEAITLVRTVRVYGTEKQEIKR